MEEGALSQIKQSLTGVLSDVKALFNTYLSLFLLPSTHMCAGLQRQIDIVKQSSYTYTDLSPMFVFIWIWAFDPCLEPRHVDSIGVIYFYCPGLQGASLTMSSCFFLKLGCFSVLTSWNVLDHLLSADTVLKSIFSGQVHNIKE